jgi:diguanylate cyclase (GGDEF)-like protein
MSSDDTAARVLEIVGRVDRTATHVVAGWLAGTEGPEAGSPQTLTDLAALTGRVAPSTLVDGHLMWRGAALEELNAEAEAGTPPALLEQARMILADRCDNALMLVSRQFDEPRDRLTGLANRSLLLERIDHALKSAARYGDAVGVIFIELEPPASGNAVFVEAGERLRRVARASDTIARLGGGEFVIVCERLRGELEAVAIADRARLALSQPYTVDGERVSVPVSEGIAVSSGGDGPETLLADASAARRAVAGH